MDAHYTVTVEEWGSLPPKTAKFIAPVVYWLGHYTFTVGKTDRNRSGVPTNKLC